MLENMNAFFNAGLEFLKLLITRFSRHDGPQNAAALAYTTLLSVVPLMTVVLAVFSSFPVADRVGDTIQSFVFENFMPDLGQVVQDYLQEFSSKASHLSGVGFAFLIVVALMMMASIDQSLNAIWEVRRKRKLLNKFLVYWAILSLGPVLISVSVLVTSYLISLPGLSEAAATGVGRRLLGLTPVIASAMGFGLIYWLVPNRRVKGWHAMLGGLLAALLFEVAKYGFALYVTRFAGYTAIYGALAAIPIFFIWVYLSWLVVLLAAEFTHCLGIFRYGEDFLAGRGSRLVEVMGVLRKLAQAQESGASMSTKKLAPYYANVEDLLLELQDKKFVYLTGDGKWVLARSAADISLYDIYRDAHCRLPLPGEPGWPDDQYLAEYFQKADRQLATVLDVSLRSGGPTANNDQSDK